MFEPPRCPYATCLHHRSPGRDFFVRHGSYVAAVHTDPVPRFRCRSCRRTFSRQTFRLDYRDRKPHLNVRVLMLLAGGSWFRKAARDVGLTRNNLEKKARKIFHHAAHLNCNLLRRGPLRGSSLDAHRPLLLQFDEFESYETRRNTRPLTIATTIEAKSRFILAMVVAPIRPHGRMTARRKEAIALDEERFGPRPHLSRLACLIALRRANVFRPVGVQVELATDRKWSYPEIARAALHGRRLVHRTTSSRAPSGVGTPLFPINHVEAKARTHVGRLQREMPLASKRRRYLSQHLELHIARRNWARPRFYTDEDTPAQFAGYAVRRLKMRELIGWRQDWGPRSPCPFGAGRRPVSEPPREARLAAS